MIKTVLSYRIHIWKEPSEDSHTWLAEELWFYNGPFRSKKILGTNEQKNSNLLFLWPSPSLMHSSLCCVYILKGKTVRAGDKRLCACSVQNETPKATNYFPPASSSNPRINPIPSPSLQLRLNLHTRRWRTYIVISLAEDDRFFYLLCTTKICHILFLILLYMFQINTKANLNMVVGIILLFSEETTVRCVTVCHPTRSSRWTCRWRTNTRTNDWTYISSSSFPRRTLALKIKTHS